MCAKSRPEAERALGSELAFEEWDKATIMEALPEEVGDSEAAQKAQLAVSNYIGYLYFQVPSGETPMSSVEYVGILSE